MGRNVTVMGQEPKEGKKELKKHAATIHCSNTLSLLQRKITNALLYHAYNELMLKEEHEITVKQLCRLIGYQGNNHSVIKDALKGLISTVIEWNVVNDETGSENWTASSIIASVSLEGPLCFYAYSPRMKQLLHSPSMFGKIDLVLQSRFRSSYGLALYENCIRYRGLPHTKWMEMDLFKKLMGVPIGKYDVFRDFKRRVLDKAIEEVNTYSDLVIEPELIREGRKVVKIRFILKERAKKTRLGVKKEILNTEELQTTLMDNFGLSSEQVTQLLNEYEVPYIQAKIAIIEESKPYQTGKVQNIAGYLLSALKKDYQTAKPKQKSVPKQLGKHTDTGSVELKRQIEQIRHEYAAYREAAIYDMIATLDPDEKTELMNKFAVIAEPTIKTILKLQRHKYTRENVLESPQIKALLRQFALQQLDIFSLLSVEEFVSQMKDRKQKEAWQKWKIHDPEQLIFNVEESA
jgi:hypothetical protein